MKTLTALAAVVALVAGIAVANAQNSTIKEPAAPPSSINKGDLSSKSSGAQHSATKKMTAPIGTTGSGSPPPAMQSQEKAKSPASTDAGIKQEK